MAIRDAIERAAYDAAAYHAGLVDILPCLVTPKRSEQPPTLDEALEQESERKRQIMGEFALIPVRTRHCCDQGSARSNLQHGRKGELLMARGPQISDAELAEWRRVYPTGGSAAVMALFPHRSRSVINKAAHTHGIKVDPIFVGKLNCGTDRKKRPNAWTPHEDDLVLSGYYARPMADLLAELPGRTEAAIRGRAVKIGATRPHAPAARRVWDAERESV